MPSSRLPAKASFPSILPLLRLDHVFANAHARLISVETVDTPLARRASDHLPVIATVALGVSDQAVRQLQADQLRAIAAAVH